MANVRLNFSTSVDLKGLQQLESKLKEIRNMANAPGDNLFGDLSPTEINKTIQAVNTLERAIKSAYNADLNTMSIDRFNQRLKESNMTIQQLRTNLAQAGPAGQQSFLILANQLTNFTKTVKYTNKFLADMQQTFKNTVTWGISSGLWNTMLSSTQKAYNYVIDLDKSLNDIRIVTGKSANEMARFAKEANKAAKELAVSTKAYTEGALIYYQQGLDNETVKTLTDITAKASNVTGQSMETVSEQLTAVWNGYQVANQAAKEGMGVYEEYVDKMAAVGAATAADLEELATAMSKVASAANSMGVGFDELSAQIATIVSVTRQAPESVGTALKTIYARMGDLQIDGVDEFGVSLGTVSSQLKTMGVDVMDANGQMRDMDEVMTEVAGKWHTWTDAQKEAAAVAMAGKRQYNNLIALFDGWDMYEDTLKTSMEAAGTLNEQQNIALESLDKKLEKMTVAAEKFYDALFDEKSIGGLIDGLTVVIDLIANLTDGIGGIGPILGILGGSLIKGFGKDIGKEFVSYKVGKKAAEESESVARQQALESLQISEKDAENKIVKDEVDTLVADYKKIATIEKTLTKEQKEQYELKKSARNELVRTKLALVQNLEEYKEKNNIAADILLKLNGQDIKEQDINDKLQKRTELLKAITDEEFNGNSLGGFNNPQEATDSYKNLQKQIEEKQIEAARQANAISNTQGVGLSQAQLLEKAKEGTLKKYGKDTKKNKETLDNLEKLQQEQDDLNKLIEESDAIVDDFVKSYMKSLKKASGDDIVKENKEVFQNFEKQLRKNIKETGNFRDAVKKTADELSEEHAELVQINNDLEENEEKIRRATEAQKKYEQQLEMEAAFSAAADAIGAVTQAVWGLTMAWNAIFGDSASDPTKSFGENVLSGLSGVAGGVTTVASSIMNLMTSLTILSKSGIPLAQKFGTAIIGVIDKIGAAIAAHPVIAAVVAIIAIIAAVVKTIANAWEQEEMNKAAAAANEAAEASKKVTKELQAEKDAIDSVAEGYKDLQEQYNKHEISLNQLRAKTYDLCNQYGLEDLALQALIADYGELENIMKNTQIEANNELIDASKDELKDIDKQIQANLYKNIDDSASENINGEKYIDVVTGAGDSGAVKDVLLDYIDESDFEGGWVSNEALSKALMKNYDEIYSRLANMSDDSAVHLLAAMDTVSDYVDRGSEVTTNKKEASKDNAILKYVNNDDINSIKEYQEAVENIIDEVEDSAFDGDRSVAKKWAQSAVGGALSDDKKQLVADYDLAKKVSKATKKSIDNVAEQIEQFNSGEKNFLLLTVDTLTAETDLEQFLKDAENQVEAFRIKGKTDLIASIVTPENKTQLTEAEKDALRTYGYGESFLNQEDFGAIRQQLITDHAMESSKINDDSTILKNAQEEALRDLEAATKAREQAEQDFSDPEKNPLGSFNFLALADVKKAKKAEEAAKSKYQSLLNYQIDELELTWKEKQTLYKNEFNAYYELEKLVNNYTDALEDLGKIKDQVFGKQLIETLEKEEDLILKNKDALEELLDLRKSDLTDSAKQLANNYGFTFDSDGQIKNYEEVTQAWHEKANNNIGNDAVQKEYQDFKDFTSQYLSDFKSLRDLANQIDDSLYQYISNNLEQWEVALEVKLETDEADRAMADFVNNTSNEFKKANKDLTKEFEYLITMANTYAVDTKGNKGTILDDVKAANDVIDEFNKIRDMKEDYFDPEKNPDMRFASESAAQNKLKELQETLMNDAEALQQLYQDAWDTYLEGIDQSAEEYEKLQEKFDKLNEELEYQQELMELLYGEDAYDLQSQIFDQQINVSLQNLAFTKQQVDLWQSMYDEAEEGSEEQLKYAELLQEAQTNLNDLTLEHVRILSEEYQHEIDNIIKTMNEAFTGGRGTLDEYREKWEDALAEEEKYYDIFEKVFALEKLEAKYQKAIDNTRSAKHQQAIANLMNDQLSALKEKEKLTEYDVTLAEKRLGILEAEAALEDARNAKNAMKLVRGADGNWNYQYVADTTEIEDKQQEVRDKYEDLYSYIEQGNKDAISEIFDTYEEYQSKMAELLTIKDEEERDKKIAELKNEYFNSETGKLSILYKEYADKVDDLNMANAELLWGLYKIDPETMKEYMTDEEIKLMEELKEAGVGPEGSYTTLFNKLKELYSEDKTAFEEYANAIGGKWAQIAASMIAWWETAEEDEEGNTVPSAVLGAFSKFNEAVAAFQGAVTSAETVVGKKFTDIAGAVGSITTELTGEEGLVATINGLDDATKDKLKDFKESVEKVGKVWSDMATDTADTLQAIKDILGLDVSGYKPPGTGGPKVDLTGPKEAFKAYGAFKGLDLQGNEFTFNDTPDSANTVGYTYQSRTDGSIALLQDGKEIGSLTSGQRDSLLNVKSQDITIHQKGTGWSDANKEEGTSSKISTGKAKAYDLRGTGFIQDGDENTWLIEKDLGYYYVDDATYKKMITKSEKTEEKHERPEPKPPFKEGDAILATEEAYPDKTNNNGDVRYWTEKKSYDGTKMETYLWSAVDAKTLRGKIIDGRTTFNGDTYYSLDGVVDVFNQKKWFKEHQLTYLGDIYSAGAASLDTGGYTGSWDSSGRLAMLHQKELVLNASDTENMLEAVKFVRDITSTVGSAIKGNVYSMLANSIGGLAVGAPWARESNDNAQPNVFNITAEFPNANSVAEIQEAILSLPNLASQYLAENRR